MSKTINFVILISIALIITTIWIISKNELINSGAVQEKSLLDLAQINNQDEFLNKKIRVVGKARNAQEGAVITGSKGMVIVKKMDMWPERFYGKNVVVVGYMSKIHYPDNGSMAAMPVGDFYYLEIQSVAISE